MGYPAITSHVQVAQGSYYVPLKDMEISEPLADYDLRYKAAELTIETRNPEITADWRPVWESMGLDSPLNFALKSMAKQQQQIVNAIGQTASNGDRVARSVTNRENNVFGHMAQEKFIQDREVRTEVGLMPERGPKFHVEVYAPEIRFEMHPSQIAFSPVRPRVQLKPLQTAPSPYIDQQI